MPETYITVADPVVFSADAGDTEIEVGSSVTAEAQQFLVNVDVEPTQVVLRADEVVWLRVRIRWTGTPAVAEVAWSVPPDTETAVFQGLSVYYDAPDWILSYITLSSETEFRVVDSFDGVGGVASVAWTGFTSGLTFDTVGFNPLDSGGDPIAPVDGDEITIEIGPVPP